MSANKKSLVKYTFFSSRQIRESVISGHIPRLTLNGRIHLAIPFSRRNAIVATDFF